LYQHRVETLDSNGQSLKQKAVLLLLLLLLLFCCLLPVFITVLGCTMFVVLTAVWLIGYTSIVMKLLEQ